MNFEILSNAWAGEGIRRIATNEQTAGRMPGSLPQIRNWGTTMLDESRLPGKQELLELIPDFAYESRREFVARLAYKLWVQRGRPLGSPDVDWFAAEQDVYASLVASGTITQSSNDPQSIRKAINRWIHGDLEK